MSKMVQGEKKMMETTMMWTYTGLVLLVGFFGSLMVDVIDRKSDEFMK